MTHRWLIFGTVGFWLLSMLPALFLGDHQTLVHSATAGLMCLMPILATQLWYLRTRRQPGARLSIVVLAGTGLRMFVVLAGGLVLSLSFDYFRTQNFWIWILMFYLATLALDVSLLYRKLPEADREDDHGRRSV